MYSGRKKLSIKSVKAKRYSFYDRFYSTNSHNSYMHVVQNCLVMYTCIILVSHYFNCYVLLITMTISHSVPECFLDTASAGCCTGTEGAAVCSASLCAEREC